MIQERIRLLMQSRSLNPTQFADEIGVQRSSISHILSGRNKPSLDIVTKILNRFPDIDSNWLVLGKGSLIQKNEPKSSRDENIAFSEPSEMAKSSISNTLFDDIQEEKILETPHNTIEDLQRKIEYLEKKASFELSEAKIKDAQIDIPDSQKEVEQKEKENNIKEVNNLVQKSSIINEKFQSDSSIQSNQQSLCSKHIIKLLVLYSDSTYEELIKN